MPSARVLTVSALTADIKRLLEQGFSSLQVQGEVSRLTRHASGHIYFTVKDAGAAISAVIWRSTASRLRCQPEEGGEFLFHGHLSLYEPRGSYQLVVRAVSPAGEGALAAEFERRKREWVARGWFDSNRKRPLPAYPTHIGIVTSQTAAALEDIRKVLHSRPAWLRLTLAPAQVQGRAAPASIAQAMANIAKSKPDLILLARGGGSMEDLWCFNDEQVVKAILDVPVPVITGIGHEIDLTLADLAADLRAATPSNAAERCCPNRHTLAAKVASPDRLRQLAAAQIHAARHPLSAMQQRLQRATAVITDHRHHQTMRLASQLSSQSRQQLRNCDQRLTTIQKRLRAKEPHQQLQDRRLRLQQMQQRLQQLPVWLRQTRQRCQNMVLRMRQHTPKLAPRQKVLQTTAEALRAQLLHLHHHQQRRWMAADRTLRALDPHKVLERGFVMVTRENGALVTSSKPLQPNDRLQLRFSDGSRSVTVTE